MDDYPTIDSRAVASLAPMVRDIRTFAEPCAGDGALIHLLTKMLGMECVWQSDIKFGVDALHIQAGEIPWADAIITNPPWTRDILHKLILHFQRITQTWLLFDADWAHTKQAIPYLDQCSHIVAAGRLKWIPDSKYTGKDNCAWYRFDANHVGGPRFINQEREAA